MATVLEGLVRRWVGKMMSDSPRTIQHQIDVLRLFVATRARSHLLESGLDPSSAEYEAKTEEVAKLVNEEADALQHLQRREAVRDSIVGQLKSVLSEGIAQQRKTGTSVNGGKGYKIELAESKVHGKGIFVRGYAPPGTLLAVYPGIVYMPLDMRQIPHYPNIGKNPYLFVRFDDVILDPDAYEPGDSVIDPRFIDPNYDALPLSMPCGRTVSQLPRSSLSIAHLFNHPPEGTAPLALSFALDLPDNFPRELGLHVPNRYYQMPNLMYLQGRCSMRAVVMVSTGHVRDEEVFLNYRYNPNLPETLPSWYKHVDREEAERIWSE